MTEEVSAPVSFSPISAFGSLLLTPSIVSADAAVPGDVYVTTSTYSSPPAPPTLVYSGTTVSEVHIFPNQGDNPNGRVLIVDAGEDKLFLVELYGLYTSWTSPVLVADVSAVGLVAAAPMGPSSVVMVLSNNDVAVAVRNKSYDSSSPPIYAWEDPVVVATLPPAMATPSRVLVLPENDAIVVWEAASGLMVQFVFDPTSPTLLLVDLPPLPTATPPVAIIKAGDIDRDGVVDLVLGDGSPSSLALVDRGSRTLSSISVLHSCVDALDVGNVNNDGYPDLVVACSAPGGPVQPELLLNTPTGLPSGPGSLVAGPGVRPEALLLGDWSGSTREDILHLAGSVMNRIYTDYTPRWAPSSRVCSDCDGVRQITSGDMNADGAVDIVVATRGDNKVRIFFGDGTGLFPTMHLLADDTSGVHSVVVAHLNEDEWLDVAQASKDDGSVTVYFNLDGTGLAWDENPLAVGHGQNKHIFALDLDMDGRLDLMTTNGLIPATVWTNKGNGSFASGVPLHVFDSPMGFTEDAAVADFDRDGRVDVAFLAFLNREILIMYNNASAVGTLEDPVSVFSSPSLTIESVRAGDMDGDAAPDLVLHATIARSFYILFNDGMGSFTLETFASEPMRSLELADFTGDGHLDIVASSFAVTLYENFEGRGRAWRKVVLKDEGTLTWNTHAVDVDSDGRVDVLYDVLSTDEVWFQGNVPDLPTPAPDDMVGLSPFSTPGDIRDVAALDVDHNGVLDLVLVTTLPADVLVSLASGSGTRAYAAPVSLLDVSQSLPGNPVGNNSVVVVDVDGNGVLDLVLLTQTDVVLLVLESPSSPGTLPGVAELVSLPTGLASSGLCQQSGGRGLVVVGGSGAVLLDLATRVFGTPIALPPSVDAVSCASSASAPAQVAIGSGYPGTSGVLVLGEERFEFVEPFGMGQDVMYSVAAFDWNNDGCLDVGGADGVVFRSRNASCTGWTREVALKVVEEGGTGPFVVSGVDSLTGLTLAFFSLSNASAVLLPVTADTTGPAVRVLDLGLGTVPGDRVSMVQDLDGDSDLDFVVVRGSTVEVLFLPDAPLGLSATAAQTAHAVPVHRCGSSLACLTEHLRIHCLGGTHFLPGTALEGNVLDTLSVTGSLRLMARPREVANLPLVGPFRGGPLFEVASGGSLFMGSVELVAPPASDASASLFVVETGGELSLTEGSVEGFVTTSGVPLISLQGALTMKQVTVSGIDVRGGEGKGGMVRVGGSGARVVLEAMNVTDVQVGNSGGVLHADAVGGLNVTVKDSLFTSCTAGGIGGGVISVAGASGSVRLINVDVVDAAGRAGGVALVTDSATVFAGLNAVSASVVELPGTASALPSAGPENGLTLFVQDVQVAGVDAVWGGLVFVCGATLSVTDSSVTGARVDMGLEVFGCRGQGGGLEMARPGAVLEWRVGVPLSVEMGDALGEGPVVALVDELGVVVADPHAAVGFGVALDDPASVLEWNETMVADVGVDGTARFPRAAVVRAEGEFVSGAGGGGTVVVSVVGAGGVKVEAVLLVTGVGGTGSQSSDSTDWLTTPVLAGAAGGLLVCVGLALAVCCLVVRKRKGMGKGKTNRVGPSEGDRDKESMVGFGESSSSLGGWGGDETGSE